MADEAQTLPVPDPTPTPVPTPVVADGVRQMNELRSGGFTQDEIDSWQKDTAKNLSDAGFSSKEIGDYFGDKAPDMAPLRQHFETNLRNAGVFGPPELKDTMAPGSTVTPEEEKKPIGSFSDALHAAWQLSIPGMTERVARGERGSEYVSPKYASTLYRIATDVGINVLDLPTFLAFGAEGAAAGGVAGAGAGFLAGSAVAGPAAGLAAGAVGGAAGTASGFMAAGSAGNAFLRKMLMDQYEQGNVKSFQDFWERASSTLLETMKAGGKGAVIGLGTGAVGGAVGMAPFTSKIAQGISVGATEVATMTALGSALDGHMPEPEDFVEAAVLVGGTHVAGGVISRLRNIYVTEGARPEEVVQEAMTNPALKEALLTGKPLPVVSDAQAGSAQKVYDQRYQELVAAGRAPEEAAMNAALHAANAKAFGEAMGILPHEVIERYPLEVTSSEEPPARSPLSTVLEQRALTPDESQAEGRLRETLSKPDAEAAYDALPASNGGTVLSTDVARQLLPEYAKDREGRVRYTEATQRPASEFIDKLYFDKVKSAPEGSVLFLSGGGGAGKTTLRRAIELEGNPAITLDSPLGSYPKAAEKIEAALGAGRKVQLAFVYRPLEEAALATERRFFEPQLGGRHVPAEALTSDHVRSLDTFLKLAEKYKDNPDVALTAYDNSGAEKAPRELSLKDLEALRYNGNDETTRAAIRRLTPQVEEILKDVQAEVEKKRNGGEGGGEGSGAAGGVSSSGGSPGGMEVSGTPEGVLEGRDRGNGESPQESSPGGVTLYQRAENAPPFYSKLERTISEKMGNSATVEQVRGLTKEIKEEERKWLGLDDFLKGKEKVSKQELLDYLRGNALEVKEVTYGKQMALGPEHKAYGEAKTKLIDALVGAGKPLVVADEVATAIGLDGYSPGKLVAEGALPSELLPLGQELREAAEARAKYEDEAQRREQTKFQQYALPGGKNYREVLFTLPPKAGGGLPDGYRTALRGPESGLPESQRWQVLGPDGRVAGFGSSEEEAIADFQDVHKPDQFRSSHFDEPNVLAHARLNERTDADGKRVLFVEEVQSDWHQAGRKKGYKGDGTVEFTKGPDGEEFYAVKVGDKVVDTANTRAAAQGILESSGLVPDAPFKKTWHEFVMKRLIREAAEKGFDRVAWTTGEQQAERYDLSKRVREIEYIKRSDGTYELGVTDINGDGVKLPKERWKPEELDDVVGKDLAQKIVNGEGKKYRGHEGRTLEGVDLKVGGEGMKGFYDKIIPDFLNKFGKKYGAKVAETTIPSSPRDGAWRLDFYNSDGEQASEGFNTEADAREYLDRLNRTSPGFARNAQIYPATESPKVHSLDITPALKKAALEEGFPLFQRSDNLQRALRIVSKWEESGKAFFNRNSDGSMTIHVRDPRLWGGNPNVEHWQNAREIQESLQEAGVRTSDIQIDKQSSTLVIKLPDIYRDAAGGGAEALGQLDVQATKAVMTFFKNANASTALHESWHYFFALMNHLADSADATPEMKAMRDAVLKEVGATSWAEMTPDQHEQLAKSGELYLSEGKAPSEALKPIFQRFKEWLSTIYQSVKEQLGVELTPQMRDIMDRMLSTESERNSLNAQSDVLGGGESPSQLVTPASPAPPAPAGGGGEPPRKSAILDRIGEPEKRRMNLSLDDLYTAAIDDLHPLKQLKDLLAGGEPIKAKDDPYTLARLTRGAYGKADQFLNHATFDFETLKNTGKSFREIMDPVKNDLDGFREYAIASRALELNAREIQTGVPLDESRRVVTEGKEKYEKVFRELRDYQAESLRYLRDSGVLSKEAYDAMLEGNKDYVPFYRVMDDEQTTPAGRKLTVKNPVKAIRGSERLLVDPIESVIKNTYTYITLAERNRVLTKLVELAEKSPDGEKAMEKVPTPIRPIKITEEEVGRFFKQQGIDASPDEMTVFRPKTLNLAKGEIVLYRDGKREIYRVSEAVAQSIKAMDRETFGLLTRMVAIPAKALRAGTGIAPDFIVRNIMRDQITAFSLSKHGYLPIYDALKGIGSLLTKDSDYQNWLKSGGANSALVAIDRDYIQKNVFDLSKETGLLQRARNLVRTPLDGLRVVSELLENATRLGDFKRATKGKTEANDLFQGGFDSREVTLDFARIGAKTRAMNLITAFWNAQVQGVDRMARAFREDPLGMTVKVTTAATIPSVLLWWANKDDERYKELPRWQKDLFWIVLTDKWAPATEAEFNSYPEYLRRKAGKELQVNKGNIWRIPKPFEVGLIFGSLPERALESYYAKNKKAFSGFMESAAQAFSPGFVPTAFLPMVEQFANRSSFTGRNIVPAVLENVLPEYQYTEYTSDTAKLLGKFVASVPGKDSRFNTFASPAVIDNYINAWSGNTGKYALMIADKALEKAGVTPDPVKPAATLADIPVIKAFAVRYPSATAQSIQDFMDRFEQSNKIVTTIKHLAQTGDFESAQKEMLLEENQHYLFKVSGIKDAISNQMKFIHLVNKNPQISPDEKRQLIDGVYYSMIEQARTGNKLFDQIDYLIGEKKK
jgi:hypothetical protein